MLLKSNDINIVDKFSLNSLGMKDLDIWQQHFCVNSLAYKWRFMQVINNRFCIWDKSKSMLIYQQFYNFKCKICKNVVAKSHNLDLSYSLNKLNPNESLSPMFVVKKIYQDIFMSLNAFKIKWHKYSW